MGSEEEEDEAPRPAVPRVTAAIAALPSGVALLPHQRESRYAREISSVPSVAGRGALFGVLYDDGQSELVCIPVLRVVLGRRARDRPPPQTPFWGTPQPAQLGGGSWRFSGERCPLSSHKHTRS